MSDEITRAELETLKTRFRAADCAVTDLDDTSFEIVGRKFPVRTHVFVTAYYVQLSTCILASHGFLLGRKRKMHAFLNTINVRAKLVKFTLREDMPDAAKGGWPILASFRLVTGVIGSNYNAAALKNLVLLWFQDIAELIASPCGFELHAMMQEQESNNA